MFNHSPWTLPDLTEQNDETGRWYINGSIKYQSVTSFIQQHWDQKGLDEWRKRVGTEEADHISKVAVDRGQALHKGIEQYLRNQGVPQYENDPYDRMLFLKIKPHLDRIDNIRVLEKPLLSHRFQLAGRPDCVSDYDAIPSVVDFKTSGKVKKVKYIMSYYLQCGFYGHMVEEFGHAIKQAVIVMATEDNPTAQIFKLPMSTCLGMVENFVKDPISFQAKMKKELKSK
jgi:hypothetical protein